MHLLLDVAIIWLILKIARGARGLALKALMLILDIGLHILRVVRWLLRCFYPNLAKTLVLEMNLPK